jgi:hypothetical protein
VSSGAALRHPAHDRGYFWEAREILEALWAAAPQGGRERILLRACILIANGNLRLRMSKPGSAGRPFGGALAELRALGQHRASASGDGFADNFPLLALTSTLKTRMSGRPFQGRLGGFRRALPSMKQNAYLSVSS